MKGVRFGRLVCVEVLDGAFAVFECDCGNTVVARRNNVKRGRTKSCGCLRDQLTSVRNVKATKHGHATRRSPEYLSWSAMKSRCLNPRAPNFSKYGGRGISVAQAWVESFGAFLADLGPRPAGTSLDRIDGAGGYEPGNCRWATPAEQRANRCR
jgi:hypothetical protein